MPARRRRAWLLVVTFAAVMVVAGVLASQRAQREDAWDEILATGVVRVAMDASYPPFEWVDDQGVYHGYDVSLAQALGQHWGVDVMFVNVAFDGLYDALMTGKADMVLSALPYDDLRTRDVRYSQAYFSGGQVIVAPAGHAVMSSEPGLRGAVVAVELGAEGHAVLARLNRDRGLDVEILPMLDLNAAVVAAESGQANALVCDRVDALRLTAETALTIVGEPLSVDPYVAAIRMDSSRLQEEIDAALATFTADGTLDALLEQWLEGRSEP
jgi:polar amino acid transport system substrate-binding protein